MRRTVAILLLACFGILVPLSASPVRVCFLDADAAAGSLMIGQNAGKDCCDGCTRESETPDPCCLDVEELPDSTPTAGRGHAGLDSRGIGESGSE